MPIHGKPERGARLRHEAYESSASTGRERMRKSEGGCADGGTVGVAPEWDRLGAMPGWLGGVRVVARMARRSHVLVYFQRYSSILDSAWAF